MPTSTFFYLDRNVPQSQLLFLYLPLFCMKPKISTMIDITRNLVNSYNDIQIGKMLFENVPFYKRFDFHLLFGAIFLGGIVIFFSLRLKHYPYFLIVYLFVIIIGGFLALNYGYKIRVKKNKIEIEKGLLKKWSSQQYEEEKQKKFYMYMINNGLLFDSKKDILLIREYEELCEKESNLSKTNKSYLIGGGVMIAFTLPVWSENIKDILKTESPDIYIDSIKLIIFLIIVIFIIACSLFMIDKLIVEFLNNRSRKFKLIGHQLRLLRLNLVIKYTQTNNV